MGSYGYSALADPSSPVFSALSGLLTIFIALYGLKLLLGRSMDWPNIIGAALKIGIVLTLATSWPAWRIVGYDLLMRGPFEVAQSIGLSTGLATQPDDVAARLQSIDDNIVVMTGYGTGRLTGGVSAGNDVGDSFKGIALADQFALGMGRAAYQVGALVPFGIFRLAAGLLLALAPLMAGLLLFGGTSAIFVGWVRGLIFSAIGTLAQSLVQGVQLAFLEPWLRSVITDRQGGILTPSAPTELFVISLTFAGISLGIMVLVMRLTFHPSHPSLTLPSFIEPALSAKRDRTVLSADTAYSTPPSRAQLTADVVSRTMRREQLLTASAPSHRADSASHLNQVDRPFTSSAGSSSHSETATAGRRSPIRKSESARSRDAKS